MWMRATLPLGNPTARNLKARSEVSGGSADCRMLHLGVLRDVRRIVFSPFDVFR
jgi:hypothetical protein